MGLELDGVVVVVVAVVEEQVRAVRLWAFRPIIGL